MNRCPNCGAERTGDSCEACGLPGAVAAVAFRRRLITHTAVLLLGAVAFLPACLTYPPLEIDAILVFVGVMFFLTLALAVWLDVRARRQLQIEALRRVFRALVPVPWLLAGLLFVNGRFDSEPPVNRVTRVVGKFTMPGTLGSTRLTVTSWREGHRFERIAVARDEYSRFHLGDAVEVRVQPGLAGIPWVYAVYHK